MKQDCADIPSVQHVKHLNGQFYIEDALAKIPQKNLPVKGGKHVARMIKAEIRKMKSYLNRTDCSAKLTQYRQELKDLTKNANALCGSSDTQKQLDGLLGEIREERDGGRRKELRFKYLSQFVKSYE